jgi:C4-dicarboxylate-specific signal transduction histidine kinase
MVGTIFKTQNVNIILDIQKGLKSEGYPNEINQVIINLLNNARDEIEANNPPCKDVIIQTYSHNGNVVMTITDFAGGISENVIDKVFDPYFSTKEESKGTGIGLDMSKTIIEKVDGTITVLNIEKEIDGKIQRGASFKIELKQA